MCDLTLLHVAVHSSVYRPYVLFVVHPPVITQLLIRKAVPMGAK